MNNIIKMLSANKDFRMVIADTHQISEKALSEFTGTIVYASFWSRSLQIVRYYLP